jgi:hypothetical protein
VLPVPVRAASSAERWQTIRQAMTGWGPTVRLCLILLVVQIPLDIGGLVWLVTRR